MTADRPQGRASLVRRLIAYLLAPLVLIGAFGAYVDYRQVRTLTAETFDQVLASAAIGLAARLETDRDHDVSDHLNALFEALNRPETRGSLRFVVQRGDGQILAGDPDLLGLAAPAGTDPLQPVFENRSFHELPYRVVTYRYAGPDGQALILVGEDQRYRVQAARHIVLASMATNGLMLILVIVSVAVAVRGAVRPLRALGERVSSHDARQLRPLRLSGVPAEVLPLVRALNRLVATVRVSSEERQAFLNQAAHQLRTPLAGLQAQVQLMLARPPDALTGPLATIERSVNRLVGLTQRMLSLARVSDEAQEGHEFEQIPLPELLEEVSSLRLDEALSRNIDLGYEAEAGTVSGVRWMLIELLLNLIDNALRHCPTGSTVTVRCGVQPFPHADTPRPFLEVIDDGPGIAPEHRRRVLSRFVRLNSASEGSGLGLAIVDQIAHRHGAAVTIDAGPDGRGTSVTVCFLVGSRCASVR